MINKLSELEQKSGFYKFSFGNDKKSPYIYWEFNKEINQWELVK
jgi:hypothetical protein